MAPNDIVQNDNTDNKGLEVSELNTDDELIKELTELQTTIQNVKAKQKADTQNNVINAIFKMMMQVFPQVKEIRSSVLELKNFQAEVSEQVSSLKAENELLKKKILDLEINKSSKGLIIKKLNPKIKKGENENQLSLKRNFDQILDRMGIKNQVKIDDIFRFSSKENETKSKQPMPVKVSFCSILDKNTFLFNLRKLKNTDFGNISVTIDVPKSLLPAYFELDKIGYDFRKENTESRVRIGFKGQGLVLYGRLKNETKFKTLKEII